MCVGGGGGVTTGSLTALIAWHIVVVVFLLLFVMMLVESVFRVFACVSFGRIFSATAILFSFEFAVLTDCRLFVLFCLISGLWMYAWTVR